MAKTPRIPSYRKHKSSGQAVVSINGRDFYLGKHGTAASLAEYKRLIAEYLASGGAVTSKTATPDITVNEVLAAFLKHANQYYRKPDGTKTKTVSAFICSWRELKPLYGRTPAAEFGPLALKAVRQRIIDGGASRDYANRSVANIRATFKWATENELVPPSVLHGLQSVAGLRRGRTDARESEPVKPVPDAFVDAVIPYVSRQVGAMIELQRITGMRSGEVTAMRAADLNTGGQVWEYTPAEHKTAHHGHVRTIYIGPRAQAIIKPFLKADLEAYLFSAADALDEIRASRSSRRRTPLSHGNRKGSNRKRRPKRSPGDRYTTDSYRRAIKRAIDQANKSRGDDDQIPSWHPHQLRHNAATDLRREFGIEVARIILGHRSAAITEVYAEVDQAKAVEVMGRVG